MTKREFIDLLEDIPDEVTLFVKADGDTYIPVCPHKSGLYHGQDDDGQTKSAFIIQPCTCNGVIVPVVPIITPN